MAMNSNRPKPRTIAQVRQACAAEHADETQTSDITYRVVIRMFGFNIRDLCRGS